MFDRELDDAEGRVYRSLGRMARAAPVALPGVIQGAQQGAVAGPWGAVAGGLVGGASRFSRPGRRVATARRIERPAPGLARPAAGLPPPAPGVWPGAPVGGVPAAAPPPLGVGNANPAAGQLLALLEDGRLAQACAALTQGTQGPREIPVDGTSAAPAAFLNLLSWLAQEAAQQAPAAGAPVDGYLKGPGGAYVADVASPAARARVLLERLQAEGAGATAGTQAAGGAAEQWLLESGLAELVTP